MDLKDDILIVSGSPRSGTSLMMQLLSMAGIPVFVDGAIGANESNPRGYFEHSKAPGPKQKSLDWVEEAKGKAIKIIDWYLMSVPEERHYKVLFMNRDIFEVAASYRKYMILERGESPSEDSWFNYFSRQALFIKETLKERPNLEVLFVNHRDLIANPGAACNLINTFLGGDVLSLEILSKVVDSSLYRNRH